VSDEESAIGFADSHSSSRGRQHMSKMSSTTKV